MVSGTPNSVIVPLVGNLRYLVDDFFDELYKKPEDAQHHKDRNDFWYEVVDGCQYHCAMGELSEENPAKGRNVDCKVVRVR